MFRPRRSVSMCPLFAWLFLIFGFLLLPRLAMAQADPDLQQGLKPYGAYAGGDIDHIDVTNGHLTVQAPLYSLPQRGKLSFGFSIFDDDAGFTIQSVCLPPPAHGCHYVVTDNTTNGVQEGVHLVFDPKLTLNQTWINSGQTDSSGNEVQVPFWNVVDADGNQHQMIETTSGNLESLDASGISVDMNSGAITDSSGIRQLGTSPVMEDANGNEITESTGTSPSFTDSLGRIVPDPMHSLPAASLSSCPVLNFTYQSLTSAASWTVPGPNGGSMTFILCYASVYVRTKLCGSMLNCQEASKSTPELQSIVLPNGKAWSFDYDAANPNDSTSIAYGDLVEILFPTGGSISYTYVSQADSCASAYTPPSRRSVVTRTVNANDGTGNHTWTYSYATGQSTITDPLNEKTVNTLTALGSSCSLYLTKAQTYDSASNLMKTVQTDYAFSSDPYAYTEIGATLVVGVVPIRTTTTWPNGQVTKTETDYDGGYSYYFPTHDIRQYCPTCVPNNSIGTTIYGKAVAVRDYDYGSGGPGSLLRQTKTAYVWQSNSNYLNHNLLSLVSSVQVLDGSGTQRAYSYFNYDETTPTASGVATQHDSAPINAPYRGNQTSVGRWINTSNTYAVTRNAIYDTGMLYQTTDPNNNTTTYTYSPSFAGAYPTQIQYPTIGTVQHIVSRNYDFNTGLMASSTDENGKTTSYSYDNMMRVSGMTYPVDPITSQQEQITITRQESAYPFTTAETKNINATQSMTTTNVFDGLGRVTQTQLNSDPQGIVYTGTTYDALGRVASVSNPYRTTTESTYGVTAFQYDALGRKTKAIDPDGSVVTTSYSGGCTTVTDEAGKNRESCTDGLGRLTSVIENPGGLGYTTTYGYDVLGNLISVVQNGSHSRSFAYDSLSRLTSSTNPEAGTVTYTYDNDGNMLTKKDARGITVTYSYDALNRTLGMTYSNGDPSVSYSYDGSGCLGESSCYNVGMRTGMTDAAGSEAWSYNIGGHVEADQRKTNGLTETMSYTYNADGSLLALTYPTGRTLTYGYDNAARPVSGIETANGINYATAAAYAPQGAMSSVLLGKNTSFAGITLSETYTNRLQPNEMKASSSAGIAMDLTYCFYALAANPAGCPTPPQGVGDNGNVMAAVNNLNSARSQTFTYDALDRLSIAQTAGTTGSNCFGFQFVYDPWANITDSSVLTGYTSCSNTVGFAFDPPINAENQITTTGFNYDASGNLLADGFNTYAWNADSEIKSAGSVNYTYDGLGNRVEKSNGTLYWYGPNEEVLDETDLSGNLKNEYVYFGGRRIAVRNASGTINYYAEDFIGSSRVMTTSTGALCYDADFLPYGQEVDYTSTCGSNFKFESKERDLETGNDDFGARYYRSALGRWLSPDWSSVPAPVPYANLTNPQTLNLYAMVSDNPETFADLDGHDEQQGEEEVKDPKVEAKEDADFEKELAKAAQALSDGQAGARAAEFRKFMEAHPQGWDDLTTGACYAPVKNETSMGPASGSKAGNDLGISSTTSTSPSGKTATTITDPAGSTTYKTSPGKTGGESSIIIRKNPDGSVRWVKQESRTNTRDNRREPDHVHYKRPIDKVVKP